MVDVNSSSSRPVNTNSKRWDEVTMWVSRPLRTISQQGSQPVYINWNGSFIDIGD